MKRLFLTIVTGAYLTLAPKAQNITLDNCLEDAVKYSTIQQQKILREEITQAGKKAVNTTFLPQININAQASYQNEVIELPSVMSQNNDSKLSKDQYRTSIDLVQNIYDGGYARHQKNVLEFNSDAEQGKIEITTLAIKEAVTNTYLGIMLANKQLEILQVTQNSLQTNIEQMQNKLKEGTVTQSNLEILEAENLRIQQKVIEAKATKKQLINALTSLTGVQYSADSRFYEPEVNIYQSSVSARPEFKVFQSQAKSLEHQTKVVNSRNMPKLQGFASAGYSRPGFNMLNDDFSPTAIIGARLTIPVTGRFTAKHEKKSIMAQQKLVMTQELDFARANKNEIDMQLDEIIKYNEMLEKDEEIVDKQKSVTQAQFNRLANGVITSGEYLIDMNNEKKAMLDMEFHKIKLIQAKYKYNLLNGNL